MQTVLISALAAVVTLLIEFAATPHLEVFAELPPVQGAVPLSLHRNRESKR